MKPVEPSPNCTAYIFAGSANAEGRATINYFLPIIITSSNKPPPKSSSVPLVPEKIEAAGAAAATAAGLATVGTGAISALVSACNALAEGGAATRGAAPGVVTPCA